MVCSACSTDVPEEDLFCENCGFRLPQVSGTEETCVCGAPVSEADEDGFCGRCGRRVRRPASDHIEQVISASFAAVSDRGLRHEKNEDRFAVVAEARAAALVVCDGVSATEHPEEASEAVTAVVARVVAEALRRGAVDDAGALLAEAFAQASAMLRAEGRAGENAPSTTAVCAVLQGEEVTVAWVGDSRAYWIGAEGAELLTRDHSWMNLALDAGEMTREEIEASPQAHAITRWIGADAGEAAEPEVVRRRVMGNGTLLLCTDGLWNYLPETEALREKVQAKDGEEALEVARALVGFANEQGGRDNVTVALLQVASSSQAVDEAVGGEKTSELLN